MAKKKKNLFPIDTKRLLPEDIKLLEELEKGGKPGGDEDFERELDRIAHTPAAKVKSLLASRKREKEEK